MVWMFDRDGERLRYEVRRAATEDRYELALTFPDGRIETEDTADAAELLERCVEVARTLKKQGWRSG